MNKNSRDYCTVDDYINIYKSIQMSVLEFFSVLRIRIRDPVPFWPPWIRDPGRVECSIRIRDPGSEMNNQDNIF